MRNDRFSYILRTVAGLYLIYLSYNILTAVMRGETGNHTLFVTIAAVIFIIAGAALAIFGGRGLIMMSKNPPEEETEEEDSEIDDVEEVQEAEPETIAAKEAVPEETEEKEQ